MLAAPTWYRWRMVNDPPRYGPAWETRRRRRVRQCDLPPGPMDVFY